MSSTSGSRLGPYELVALLGAGGMGEVWRGRDTRLEREVAIKLLPEGFAQNEQFQARFEREAKTISSLNHPNICTLHDVGNENGQHYLVMELIEGESLADRLHKGALPIDQVVRYGAQIADALGRAHRQGIVHRDLKPANIMLTKSGAKLLDFGLARSGTESQAITGLTNMPTQAKPLTAEGTILGTFQYMAPEQLEGLEADARTDIFGFGAVLYEMATGRRAFEGHSKTSLIAAIVASQPPPIASLQSMSPAILDRIVHKCLEKDPDDRWQSAYDIASELRWISEEPPQPPAVRRGGVRMMVATAVLALAAGAAVAWWVATRSSNTQAQLLQASIEPPAVGGFAFVGDYAGTPVLSPDGRKIAYCVVGDRGISQLWVRELAMADARPIAGTEGAYSPFWSPDSQSIAYFNRTELIRVDLTGGAPRLLAAAPQGKGGSWSQKGVILFTPDAIQPIFSVPASGGAATRVTTLDPSRHTTHRWVHFLRDGNRFIYLAANHQDAFGSSSEIWVSSLDGKTTPHMVVKSLAEAQIAGDKLLTLDGNDLVAYDFDEGSAKVTSSSTPLDLRVVYDRTTWKAAFSVADHGVLAYVGADKSGGFDVNWYTRDGKVTPSGLPSGNYARVEINPSETTAAFEVQYDLPNSDLWTADLRSGVQTRLTVETFDQTNPVWTPDGSRLYFASNAVSNPAGSEKQTGWHYKIYSRRADGGGGEKVFYEDEGTSSAPWNASPDGRYVLVSHGDYYDRKKWTLQVVATEGDKPAYQLPGSGTGVGDAMFSPDGRLVAFTSTMTGREEIYVVQFLPDASHEPTERGGRWQISNAGGRAPRWRKDTRELYYIRSDNTLVAVPIEMKGDSLIVGREEDLFQAAFRDDSASYDVLSMGQRFLVATLSSTSRTPFRIVSGWPSLLKK